MLRILAALAVPAALLSACSGGASEEPLPFKKVAVQPYLGQTVLGDPDAPVEIVEYASTTCSHCRHFHKEELPKLKAGLIDTGKTKLRYIVLPTAPPEVSLAGAAVARCAGKDKFFDVIADLFEHQGELVDVSARQLQKRLSDIGGRHGLSFDQVNTCIEHQPIFDTLKAELADIPDTVTGTPSFFVAGEKVDEPTAAAISAAVEKKRAAPAAPAAPQ